MTPKYATGITQKNQVVRFFTALAFDCASKGKMKMPSRDGATAAGNTTFKLIPTTKLYMGNEGKERRGPSSKYQISTRYVKFFSSIVS